MAGTKRSGAREAGESLTLAFPVDASDRLKAAATRALWTLASGRDPCEVRKLAGCFEWAFREYHVEDALAVLASCTTSRPLPNADAVMRTVADAAAGGFLRLREAAPKPTEGAGDLPLLLMLPAALGDFVEHLAERFTSARTDGGRVYPGAIVTVCVSAVLGALTQLERQKGGPLTGAEALDALRDLERLQRAPVEPEALRPDETAKLPGVAVLLPEHATWVQKVAAGLTAAGMPTTDDQVVALAIDAAMGICVQRGRDLGQAKLDPAAALDAL